MFESIKAFFVDVFDSRFSWRFKLANWIMGDELRFNLAVIRMNLNKISEKIDRAAELNRDLAPEELRFFKIFYINRLILDIDQLWKYPN